MTHQRSIANNRGCEVNRRLSPPRVTDIRNLSACHPETVLSEQTAEWNTELDWDFSKSAALLRTFLDAHRLTGFALLHVRPHWRDERSERLLFDVLNTRAGIPRPEVYSRV